MQKVILILLSAISFIACQSTTHNLGEQFLAKNPMSVDSFIQKINAEKSLKDIQIEGKIEKSCMSEGCWFTINDAAGKEIMFDVKDKKFRVPINSPGKTAVILADATTQIADITSKNNTDSTFEESTIKVEVKGLLFK